MDRESVEYIVKSIARICLSAMMYVFLVISILFICGITEIFFITLPTFAVYDLLNSPFLIISFISLLTFFGCKGMMRGIKFYAENIFKPICQFIFGATDVYLSNLINRCYLR